MTRHRHERSSWLICGGYIEWCYQCGAWRRLRRECEAVMVADSKWTRPVGVGRQNPALRSKA